MSNLFQSNFSQEVIDSQNALRTNIAFCQRIVSDLGKSFDVVVQTRRRYENEVETTAYPPDQIGRYGYGFRFNVTDKGVILTDENGLPKCNLAKILGVSIANQYTTKDADLKILRDAVASMGALIAFTPNSSTGDSYNISIPLSESSDLNVKIKLIIKVLLAHNITSRL